jgi:hypothetical protein
MKRNFGWAWAQIVIPKSLQAANTEHNYSLSLVKGAHSKLAEARVSGLIQLLANLAAR